MFCVLFNIYCVFNTLRAWNLIGRPTRGWKWDIRGKLDGEKLLEFNKFWNFVGSQQILKTCQNSTNFEEKNLNLIQWLLHNPSDSSILIFRCNEKQHSLQSTSVFLKPTIFGGLFFCHTVFVFVFRNTSDISFIERFSF